MPPTMDHKELYIEVMDFLYQSGGTYACWDNDTFRDVIDALFDERYRVIRDETGTMTSFTAWWMIHETDLEMVKNGGRPKDISGGTIVYVADHAGKESIIGLIKYLRDTFIAIDCCWHHRYKHPAQFRYRRKMEARIA